MVGRRKERFRRSWRLFIRRYPKRWRNTATGNRFFISPATLAAFVAKKDGSAHCGSRPYDPENPNARCSAQSKKPEGIAAELADVIIRVLDYCAYAGIDIENVLEVKHEYNKSRPYRHGGKKC